MLPRQPPRFSLAGDTGARAMHDVDQPRRIRRQKGPTQGLGVLRLLEVSPKQPGSRGRRDWYPYYAGFTERFVEAVVNAYLRESTSVLDPWSGSGTTTATCLRLGVKSLGLDINPVATVLARARLNAKTLRKQLLTLGARVVKRGTAGPSWEGSGELLEQWMTPEAARRVLAFRRAIHEVLEEPFGRSGRVESLGVDRLSATACFFYCALFGSVRNLLSRFGTTNPMWLKPPRSKRYRVRSAGSAIGKGMEQQMAYLAARLTLGADHACGDGSFFRTANAARTGLRDNSFDAVLTSPPYATRLDYVKGTLPELAVLGADSGYVQGLRGESTGSPTVGGRRGGAADVRSQHGRAILSAIGCHESKGSASYYLPWMTKYLGGLQSGLEEIDRAVAPSGRVCVVVQDSYYKEVHIDLQTVVTETFLTMGWPEPERHDYAVASRRHGPRYSSAGRSVPRLSRKESLLVFGPRPSTRLRA